MPPTRFQAPAGTRDMYPQDLLRRRYIEKLWRDTAIRHGFEEIDGPTFEHADLYAVKSGEGILSELFQVFSGKDAGELDAIRAGKSAPYALRPEFTPTLARMYAAKAGSLPKPTRWFWMQNCYRAERQQRGRLREFGQWNCDILGTENEPEARARADGDCIAVVVGAMEGAGLPAFVGARVCVNDRGAIADMLVQRGVPTDRVPAALALIDKASKIGDAEFQVACERGGFRAELLRDFDTAAGSLVSDSLAAHMADESKKVGVVLSQLQPLMSELAALGTSSWATVNYGIVRGLAYYTGTVFEVLADNERAIAGGGRYDNLIELFGGPPTPAVGFGMGDVVLSLVLQDRGLLPEGDALMDALSRPSASYRPDAFVLSAGQTPQDQDAAAAQVRPLVARLRRGTESQAYLARENHKPWDADRYAAASGGAPPLHARSTSKATKNIGKLLQDAVAQKSKLAIILESGEEATIKDLRTNTQDATRTRLADLPRVIAERLVAG